ncbi:hypothetical protein [Thermoactinospora rubra]|uniref:hypothetical protein n=1 Tax=Thermoactinospora rubra TaxID=1088767 RepID=UPI000A106163|nr:hypothetical protein [Thermoactinospora rubra]
MASTYAEERRTHLQALAELLPGHGLVGRMVGGADPVLWAWHPRTGRQTLVFATPTQRGWLFLWSPGGQGTTDDLEATAQALRAALGAEPS